MFRGLLLLLAAVATTSGNILVPTLPLLDGRIIGGENTNIEHYPYQVSLRVLGAHQCGASIVNKRVVITAGHCVYNIAAKYYGIQYGSTDVNSGKTVTAERLVKHENYNSNTLDNDIALVFLAEDIVFGLNAQPIALASLSPAPGTKAVVSGWGVLTEGGSLPSTLQKVDVVIISEDKCRRDYVTVNEITNRMLCAGVNDGGKDACQGDSGGPLVTNNELVGIVSWGYGCARPNYPGVYTNVANMRSWIDTRI